MIDIITFDHFIWLVLGAVVEFAFVWGAGRVKTLAHQPAHSLTQDSIDLVEKLIDHHLNTGAAVSAIAQATGKISPPAAGTAQ